MQVTPTHGSPMQAPLTQPKEQNSVWLLYWHVPPTHVPGTSKTVRSFGPEQYLAGGMLQSTPVHGSPLHAPPLQPFWQNS